MEMYAREEFDCLVICDVKKRQLPRLSNERVIWLHEKTTNSRYYVSRENALTVRMLKVSAGQYSALQKWADKEFGFLELTFKKKPLNDNFAPMDDLTYPDETNISTFPSKIKIHLGAAEKPKNRSMTILLRLKAPLPPGWKFYQRKNGSARQCDCCTRATV
jgi:hypothetical protein